MKGNEERFKFGSRPLLYRMWDSMKENKGEMKENGGRMSENEEKSNFGSRGPLI